MQVAVALPEWSDVAVGGTALFEFANPRAVHPDEAGRHRTREPIDPAQQGIREGTAVAIHAGNRTEIECLGVRQAEPTDARIELGRVAGVTEVLVVAIERIEIGLAGIGLQQLQVLIEQSLVGVDGRIERRQVGVLDVPPDTRAG